MSTDISRAGTTLSERVAEEIRSWMGRRRITGAHLARSLGVSPAWISYRLTGTQPIDLNDLARIAAVLDVEVSDLIPRGPEGRTVVIAGEPRRQTTVPKLRLTDQPHPNGYRNRTAPAPGTRRPARLSPAHA